MTSVDATRAKGAISLLQEFVQSSTKHHLPPNHSVLQWKFDTRMADEATLQFSATVTFLLEGVPHHAAGSWYPSKKTAQRDAAERSLRLFASRWAEEFQQKQQKQWLATPASRMELELHAATAVRALQAHCQKFPDLFGSFSPRFTVAWLGNANLCQAHIELELMGIPHKFKGALMRSEDDAQNDAARRVLWYLQCPGFQEQFELDPADPALRSMKIAPPAESFVRDDTIVGEAAEVAKKKTAVMMVQNRLQQVFSRCLRPGQSVWEWNYETEPDDQIWPPLYRATVQIPVVNRSFSGEWARGQREAQLSAINHVEGFLDAQQESSLAL